MTAKVLKNKMEKLGKLGNGPCLCTRPVSFLLEHSECYHQFPVMVEIGEFSTPKVGVLVLKTGTSALKIACSSYQNLNLSVGVYCRQAQDGRRSRRGRGKRPRMTTFGWKGERERHSNGGGKNFPKFPMPVHVQVIGKHWPILMDRIRTAYGWRF